MGRARRTSGGLGNFSARYRRATVEDQAALQRQRGRRPGGVGIAGRRRHPNGQCTRLIDERERLYVELERFGFLQPVPSSRGNFILCRVLGRDARQLKLALEQQGVLVRHFAKPGLENCIRISAGRPEDSERLLTALRAV